MDSTAFLGRTRPTLPLIGCVVMFRARSPVCEINICEHSPPVFSQSMRAKGRINSLFLVAKQTRILVEVADLTNSKAMCVVDPSNGLKTSNLMSHLTGMHDKNQTDK